MQNYTTCITGYNWLTSNKLSLNIKKSDYVIFRPYRKKLNYDPQVNVFDNESNKKVTLERKNFIKYLGLLIDENLSWKTHIHSVANKISKTIGLIARLRHIVPTCTLLNIYQSLITPYLTYGLISWGNACKTSLNFIRLLRVIITPSVTSESTGRWCCPVTSITTRKSGCDFDWLIV